MRDFYSYSVDGSVLGVISPGMRFFYTGSNNTKFEFSIVFILKDLSVCMATFKKASSNKDIHACLIDFDDLCLLLDCDGLIIND